jgi:hypothetical protein
MGTFSWPPTIAACGAPKELLSDNSLAFNQLRAGTFGSVEIFLASKGTGGFK